MSKRKLIAAEKAEKKRRKAMFETVFINGKQKRVRRNRPDSMVDGYLIDDPIYLKQNEMWEELHAWEIRQNETQVDDGEGLIDPHDQDLPF